MLACYAVSQFFAQNLELQLERLSSTTGTRKQLEIQLSRKLAM